MKYNLINIETDECFACEKVVANNGDTVYVCNGKIIASDPNNKALGYEEKTVRDIEYVEALADRILSEINEKQAVVTTNEDEERIFGTAFIMGYNHRSETNRFTEEDMTSFAEYVRQSNLPEEWYSASELFDNWMEEKPKTLYFKTKNTNKP